MPCDSFPEGASNRMSDKDRFERTDEELVAAFQANPTSEAARQAASLLLARYQRSVYVWCLRYVKEHEAALDLAQDVLLRAYRSLERFRGASQFSSWLFVIARNRCLNAVRRPPLLRDEEADPEVLADPEGGPEAELETREADETVRRLMEECLDETERRALYLRCHERMPVDEITKVLEIGSASGARGLLQTARRKLRAGFVRLTEEEASLERREGPEDV